ncbi:MAG TPA: hypothetical protein VIQ30_22740 [Pseudonocardia sp.]
MSARDERCNCDRGPEGQHQPWCGEEPESGLDLDAIRARAEGATDGPWVVGGTAPSGGVYFGTTHDPDDWDEPGVLLGTALAIDGTDAEFIVHAREDVPALLAEVERLRGMLSTARGMANAYQAPSAVVSAIRDLLDGEAT